MKLNLYASPAKFSNSETATQLLTKAIGQDTVLDVSPFRLTISQIERVLIYRPLETPTLTSLNLSGNSGLTTGLLEKILQQQPNLATLYLLNTPQISLQCKLSLVEGTKIREYLDTDLLAAPFINLGAPKDGETVYIVPAVSQIVIKSLHPRQLREEKLPRTPLGRALYRQAYAVGERLSYLLARLTFIFLHEAYWRRTCVPLGQLSLPHESIHPCRCHKGYKC